MKNETKAVAHADLFPVNEHWHCHLTIGGLYRVSEGSVHSRILANDIVMPILLTGDGHYRYVRLISRGSLDSTILTMVQMFSGYADGARIAEHYTATPAIIYTLLAQGDDGSISVPHSEEHLKSIADEARSRRDMIDLDWATA